MSTPNSDAPISPLTGLDIAVLTASTSATLVRWNAAPNLVKAFYRILFAVALLAPVALVRHRGALATISGRDLLAAGGASVALAAHFASWFESLNHTTVAANVTLVQSQPLFVAVGTWTVLDGRASRCTAVGIGVALVDTALMSVSDSLTTDGVSRPLLGDGLTVVGTMTMAAYVLTGRSVHSRVSLVPYMVVIYLICAVALPVVAVDRGDLLAGYPPHEWLLFPGMAVGPGVFGHTAINRALTHLESGVVPISLLGGPIGSMILALFLLGEIPALPTVLGGAVVLGGIYVSVS